MGSWVRFHPQETPIWWWTNRASLAVLFSCAGGGSEHGSPRESASGRIGLGRLKLLKYKSLGAGLTDRKPDACASPCPEETESPLARIRRFPSLFEFRPHSREARISVLGNAKLLPPVVHVKRETLQVVSLAMTGLVPDWGQDFHKKTPVAVLFSVSQASGVRFGCSVNQWLPCNLGITLNALHSCFLPSEPTSYIRPNRVAVLRTGWGDLRARGNRSDVMPRELLS